jgi:predicted HicB family RNase H-like nuclease
MMTYKGYIGHVTYDDEARLLHGEVVNIRDVVTFQGQSVDELENAFHDSVDDYLEMCAERGEAPDKPFSGRFVVRLDPELHKASYLAAKSAGKSLNAWIADTLRQATQPQSAAIK